MMTNGRLQECGSHTGGSCKDNSSSEVGVLLSTKRGLTMTNTRMGGLNGLVRIFVY